MRQLARKVESWLIDGEGFWALYIFVVIPVWVVALCNLAVLLVLLIPGLQQPGGLV